MILHSMHSGQAPPPRVALRRLPATGIVEHFRVGSAPPDLGPLVVFVNPKSGGNQGLPRDHVFDQ